MDKSEFLSLIRTERQRWEELLEQIPPERMESTGASGEWSVKDVIAHISWHEREMVGLARARALVGSELWALPLQARNTAIFEQHRQLPLQAVLEEAQRVFPEMMAELEKLTDEDLNDPARYPGMPPDWQPWNVIASNTYEHYQDHIRDLQEWLNRPR
jgi:hypothetical protein